MDRLLIPGLFRSRPVLRSRAAARSAGRVRVTPLIESPVRTIVMPPSSVAIRLPRSPISLPAREPPLLPFLVAIAKYSRKVAYIAIHYFEFATVSFVFKRLALRVCAAGEKSPRQQRGLLLIGAPGRTLPQSQFIDGLQYLLDRPAQARACVRFQCTGGDATNLQPTLLGGNKQRVSKVIAVRRMNQRMRGENRRQGNLLAARGVDDADGAYNHAAALPLFRLGAEAGVRG